MAIPFNSYNSIYSELLELNDVIFEPKCLENKIKSVLILIVLVWITGCTNNEEKFDPVASFEDRVGKYFQSYKTDNRGAVVNFYDKYVNVYHYPLITYSIDVQTTNSLVSPYIGYLNYRMVMNYTQMHKSFSEASMDSIFYQVDTTQHKHTYSYQNDKWVLKTMKHFSLDDKWESCDKPILYAEVTDNEHFLGCWEK